MLDTKINWSDLVWSEHGAKEIEWLAQKRFSAGPLAEEAATFVLEQLSDNNWKKCHAFKGQSSPKTFLYSLTHTLLEDFSRKRFGRPRPPSWLQRQGSLWVDIWKKTCLERQSRQTVIDQLCTNQIRQASLVENIMRTIYARIPSCGLVIKEPEAVADIIDHVDQHDADNAMLDNTTFDKVGGFSSQRQVQKEILLMLRTLFSSPTDDTYKLSDECLDQDVAKTAISDEKLQQLRQAIELQPQEKIMLKMLYEDGLSRATIANALSMSNYEVDRDIRKILTRIADQLKQYGLSIDDFIKTI